MNKGYLFNKINAQQSGALVFGEDSSRAAGGGVTQTPAHAKKKSNGKGGKSYELLILIGLGALMLWMR